MMTAYSAKVNEHNRVFDTTLPGGLSDVFGIRCGAFVRTRSHTPAENAGGLEKTELHLQREKPIISFQGCEYRPGIDYYEMLEPHAAVVTAEFVHARERSPAVTRNRYGKGEAWYVAIPAESGFLAALLDRLYAILGIEKGPVTPTGVAARRLEDGSVLYVNTTGTEQKIELDKPVYGLLSGQDYACALKLDAYEVELLSCRRYRSKGA